MMAAVPALWAERLEPRPAALVGVIGLHDGAGSDRGFWLVPEQRRRGVTDRP